MSEDPTLRYEERRPSGRFRLAIECFWNVVDSRPRGARAPEQVLPDGCPELIVHRGDSFCRQREGRWHRQPRAFLAGTLTRPWRLRAGRVVDTFGIRFRPGGLPALVAVDMRRTIDREVPLAELVGAASARRLPRMLEAAAGLAGRAAAAEAWLAALPPPRPSRRAVAARAAVERIRASRGSVRIAAVARELGLSRRHLERAFARDLGLGPKLFARIVRLQAALLELGEQERAAGVEVALAAGYFDQSHLLRDFRALAGRPASRARATDGELARHFTAPERLLALLEGE